ncbi:MAG: hypothetical protein CMO01_18040 [Thalassobius sp.]|nr:hypothetical protein [Thalassovita sp.]
MFGLSLFSQALSFQQLSYADGRVICNAKHKAHDLKVYFGNHSHEKSASILPLPSIEGKQKEATFIPTLPFSMGETYTAVCQDQVLVFTVAIPSDYERASVTAIYPSQAILPANQLKFYIQFSQPMATQAYTHIDLIDKNGEPVYRAILKEIPELWSENRQLLCVWLEPGRIKQGLGPNEKLGTILKEGEGYTLKISVDLRDAQGIKIKEEVTKRFTVKADDRAKPNYKNWNVAIPKSDSREAIKISFNEAMDYGSVISLLNIENEASKIIKGTWEVNEKDSKVYFYPESNWQKGNYKLAINTRIEDLAGNNLNRLFDQDIKKQAIIEEVEVVYIDVTIE